jgi:hypothetical protein
MFKISKNTAQSFIAGGFYLKWSLTLGRFLSRQQLRSELNLISEFNSLKPIKLIKIILGEHYRRKIVFSCQQKLRGFLFVSLWNFVTRECSSITTWNMMPLCDVKCVDITCEIDDLQLKACLYHFNFFLKIYLQKIKIILQNVLHRPGLEPGSSAWQANILPLNQRCFTFDV